jgi:hypothetical protein
MINKSDHAGTEQSHGMLKPITAKVILLYPLFLVWWSHAATFIWFASNDGGSYSQLDFKFALHIDVQWMACILQVQFRLVDEILPCRSETKFLLQRPLHEVINCGYV